MCEINTLCFYRYIHNTNELQVFIKNQSYDTVLYLRSVSAPYKTKPSSDLIKA